MKIVFLCGCLESGRDGVGDYTKRLSTELIRRGHQISAIALNDPYVKDLQKEVESSDGLTLPVCRIPELVTKEQRYKIAKRWIDQQKPELLSLQFVPFSFNSKGLPFYLASTLKELGNGRAWHIMFHELWVGSENRLKLKLIVLGILQKVLIKKLIVALNPSVIHSQLPINKIRLEKLGWNIKHLPIFSNIEVSHTDQIDPSNGIFRIGLFSQVEMTTSIIRFLEMIRKELIQNCMRIEILLISGAEERMANLKKIIEDLEGFNNSVHCTGFLKERELSHVLQTCSLGITSVPRHALGKSGSVAAFLAHGVPVAAPNVHLTKNGKETGFFDKELLSAIVLEPELNTIEGCKEFLHDVKARISLSNVAAKFLGDINTPSNVSHGKARFWKAVNSVEK